MNKIWIIFLIGIIISGVSLILFVSESITTQAAVIPIRGEISFSSYEANPTVLREEIKKAESDLSTDAIVFMINSPGGSVVASREMGRLIKEVEKPTVCWLGDVAASGAYWVASGCDEIVADPLTITGSIGVSASYLEFSELMEKYGVEYQRLIMGEHKDIGSPYKNLTGEEREILLDKLEKIYEVFVSSVAENRGMDYEEVENLADGSIYLGEEAFELGLVDYLGGQETVEKVLEEKTGKKVILVEQERSPLSIFEILSTLKNEGFPLSGLKIIPYHFE
jgi:protease-4